MPKIRFTSLLFVEERLLEADYFGRRLGQLRSGDEFGYELNAFVAAARSVTFLLQKEMKSVPGFAGWWDQQRNSLSQDAAASFFLKLRNFSQKEGRISVVGSAIGAGRRMRWSYRFTGNAEPVPTELLHRDVAECCREHVAKLARIVLACTEAFPYQTCPRRTLTLESMKALRLDLQDVEESLGFPRGWTKIGDPVSDERRIHILREQVDGLDFVTLERLAHWKPKSSGVLSPTASASLSEKILKPLVEHFEGPR